jgi:outer membrane protein assembly factor BamD
MVIPSFMRLRAPLLFAVALAMALAPASRLAADLVWTPGTGWHAEGGMASAFAGEEGKNALDLMNKAREAEEAGSRNAALKSYQKVIKKYGNSIYASEALFRIGLIYQKKKQYFKAFDSFQNLLRSYPNSPKFNQVIAEQYRIASILLEGGRPYVWGIFPGFRNREQSVGYFEQIVANAPYSDYAPLSLMNAARGERLTGQTEEALDALDRMINNYPKSALTPDAYLKIAQAHASLVDGPDYDQAATKEAITYYQDYLILFPGDSGAADAEKGLAKMKTILAQSKMVLADFYFKYRKNYQAAKVFYNEAITVYPDSDVANKAKEKLHAMDIILEKVPKPAEPGAPKTDEPKKKKKFLGIF